VERHAFYDPDEIARQVADQVESAARTGAPVDYLSFVPDGEPTLDLHLGREIELLRPLGIPIAVITNASLVWREDVRADLMRADWVSLKVDAAQERVWRRVNRPNRALDLDAIAKGMLAFAAAYEGTLVTETMLVEGVNDGDESLQAIAALLRRLRPAHAYLSVPTRPPAATWVRAPGDEAVRRAYGIVREAVGRVTCLTGAEGDAFATTGSAEEDLLAITAVHPMREGAVRDLLARAGADWEIVDRLIARGQLVEIAYEGQRFYKRQHNAERSQHDQGTDRNHPAADDAVHRER
jgi:wyosine [tRNA(Phe)-imidazoG37] synthetase (radical SAM superfamily)